MNSYKAGQERMTRREAMGLLAAGAGVGIAALRSGAVAAQTFPEGAISC
jgi:hypothetical protein